MTSKKINDLEKAVEKKIRIIKRKEESYRKGDEEYHQKITKYWERENLLKKEKLSLFKDINSWARKFSKSNIFKKLLNHDERRILIYGSNWGHEIQRYGDYGCWSHLHLNKNGDLSYREGYKQFGERYSIDILNNNSVLNLSYDYLKGLCDEIKSEDIYDRVKNYIRE